MSLLYVVYICVAHVCIFPDMLCIEGVYSDIGLPLVAAGAKRVVIQTAAGVGSGVPQRPFERQCCSLARLVALERGRLYIFMCNIHICVKRIYV